jgi:hypothetical protein
MSPAMRDAALTIGLAAAFATLLTVHVATLFGLARRRHIGAALVGLVVPPVAPFWAFLRGMRARAALWIASAVLYATAVVLAAR